MTNRKRRQTLFDPMNSDCAVFQSNQVTVCTKQKKAMLKQTGKNDLI